MRRLCLTALAAVLLALGCGDRTPKAPPQLDIVADGGGTKPIADDKGGPIRVDVDTGNPKPAEVEAKLPDVDAYEAAVMRAVGLLAEGNRQGALESLEAAQKIKDTGLVQREIDKVRAALAQEAAAVKAVEDVKTVLADGKADDAAKLASAALAQHGGGDQAAQLASLQQQADAVVTAGAGDADARLARLTAEAAEAEKQQNLRAASVALEQATALRPDEALAARLADIRDRLATYDENRRRAAEMRKDSARLDEALTRLVAARAAWATPQVAQEIDEVTLALERRRDRLGVADFEVRGDVGVAGIGRTVAEEMLGYFKPRYDLVERSQLLKVFDELKLDAGDLIEGREGGRSVARLAKVRYLVVGSITPLAGITVQARLVEVSTGLVVQTARVSAPDLESLVPRLKQVAVLLQMTDDQKAAYEDRLQAVAVAVRPIAATPLVDLPPPPPVTLETAAPPPPILTYTPARPALGGLVIEDYRALPPVVLVPQPPPPLALQLRNDDPRRLRLFRLSLELGDNLFRRRRYAEANRHFSLALSLGGPRRELSLRLDACRPHLPPPAFVAAPVIGLPVQPVYFAPPVLRPRVAVFGFDIYAPAALVPPSASELLADQFASYCGGSYDVIDRGEVCWYMGRLGLTMRDLLNDPVNRRCLAQSLNARYLIFGTVTPTASFNVETHLFDATSGDRTASARIHVQDHAEMKLRLGELAQQLGAKPADRAAIAKQGAAAEKAIADARALTATDPARAADVASAALKAQPDNVALQSILAEAQRKQRLASVQAIRGKEAAARVAAQKRQAELAKQLDLAKARAVAEAKSRDAATRKAQAEQKDRAAARLRQQAAAASKGGDAARAAHLLQGAVALAPSKAGFDELAQAQAKAAEARRANDLAAQAARDRAAAASRESAQARIAREKAARDKADAERRAAQAARDKAAHDAYLKQATDFAAKKEHAKALSAAEAAHRLHPGPEGAKLVSDSRHQLDLIEADKKGAVERAKVEAERKARAAADAKSKADHEAYNAAVKKGHDALLAKRYDDAIASYTAASRLFRTDAALGGIRAATDQKAAAGAKTPKPRDEDYKLAMSAGLAAAKKSDWTGAANAYAEALRLRPGDAAATAARADALTRSKPAVPPADPKAAAYKAALTAAQAAAARGLWDNAIKDYDAALAAKPGDAAATAGRTAALAGRTNQSYALRIKLGQASMAGKKYAEAIAAYDAALKLKPGDAVATRGKQDATNASAPKPKDAPPPPKANPLAEYTRAMQSGAQAEAQKKWADAATAYATATRWTPGDFAKDAALKTRQANAYLGLARAEHAQGRYADAIKAYDEVLKRNPADATAKAGLTRAKANKP